MTADPLSLPAEPAALPHRPPAPGAGPSGAFRRFLRWYDRYLQRRTLAELDERLRDDIGLTREDIRRECRKLF